MADLATAVEVVPAHAAPAHPALVERLPRRQSSRSGMIVFVLALLTGLSYIGFHVTKDLSNISLTSIWPLCVLGVALLIALGFEFVNGFHDTANAVATVIYTNSLPPTIAVVWSGLCNLAGVLVSSGTVAFAVITLLPVELILKVSSGTGYAMVFALLIAAILWNLGTWWFGLPASSSHTMVGSIIGVGLASQLMNLKGSASGLDWSQVVKVLEALLISPVLGFALAGILLLIMKWFLRFPSLYEAPKGNEPPPWPIRALMVVTCTGVSYFHGSNDGQKGMGLIMLILIGTVPTAYALNHDTSQAEVRSFIAASVEAEHILERHIVPGTPDPDPRTAVTDYIQTKQMQPYTLLALSQLVNELNREVSAYKTLSDIPAQDQTTIRNDMYLAGRALKVMDPAHDATFTSSEKNALKNYQARLDKSTKFIPDWVKVAVALALGLGTMVGWRRIVVTVGEKIGKEPMSYAQGASAGLVTMATIFAADTWSLPVSTTHILSSGVAGTMAANGSGMRLTTVRNIAAGWVCTMPAAALLSGLLYCLFRMF
jgi:inorganic phosphate transporter, PiT family